MGPEPVIRRCSLVAISGRGSGISGRRDLARDRVRMFSRLTQTSIDHVHGPHRGVGGLWDMSTAASGKLNLDVATLSNYFLSFTKIRAFPGLGIVSVGTCVRQLVEWYLPIGELVPSCVFVNPSACPVIFHCSVSNASIRLCR